MSDEHKRRRPPSYYRYNERNPLVTVRLTKTLKFALDSIRQKHNMSYPAIILDLIRKRSVMILKGKELSWDNIYREGYQKGYRAGYLEGEKAGLKKCGY